MLTGYKNIYCKFIGDFLSTFRFINKTRRKSTDPEEDEKKPTPMNARFSFKEFVNIQLLMFIVTNFKGKNSYRII